MMRKQHSPSFKTQLVVSALRETKTLAQIAAENEIHPTLVTKWKTEAVAGLLDVFERGAKREATAADHERKVAELYEQIGRLTTQVNWLKKKSGQENPFGGFLCIVNSDQGSHFTSERFTGRLLTAGVRVSMAACASDGRGRYGDNIFTQRLWRSVKYEEVYLSEYSCPREVRQGLSRYLLFYNNRRPHQALGNVTPARIYEGNRP